MEEEFLYPSDEELATSFVDDLFSAFMVEIKKYPVLSINEQKELAREYKKGDISAREKLFNHNLRLVVYVASAFKNRINHLKIMDIIQEGTIGLMKAIDKYDPEIGAFSTYAINWIRQAISRAIDDNEEEIRKPVHMIFKIRKYRYLCNQAKSMNLPIPSDEELMRKLDCPKETLELIKEKAAEQVVSVQTKVGDEEDSELGDFIPDSKDEFDEVLNNLNDHELLAVIKEKLSCHEYYFLYNYDIDKKNDDITLEKLAKDFYITRERVRQIKKKAYGKIGNYVKNRNIRHREVTRIEKEIKVPITMVNVTPININNIIVYKMLKDELDDLERRILANLLFGEIKMDNRQLANYFDVSIKEYGCLIKMLKGKIVDKLKDNDSFEEFKSKLLKMYGTKIFTLVPEDEIKRSLISNKDLSKEKKGKKERKIPSKVEEEIKEFSKIEEVKEEPPKEKENKKINDTIKKAMAKLEGKQEKEIDVFSFVSINDHNLLVVIKDKLTPLDYFMFYRLLENKDNQEEVINKIAKLLKLSTVTIMAYKNRIVKKLKKYLSKKDFLNNEIPKLGKKYNTQIENIRDDPVDLDKIIILAYVQEYLTDNENKVLRWMIFGPTKEITDYELKLLGITKEEYLETVNQLQRINDLMADVPKFRKFKNKILTTYGPKIFDIGFDKGLDEINYEALKLKFDSLSFDEIKRLYGDSWEQLDINAQNLLKRYFTIPKMAFSSKENLTDAFYLELNNININGNEPHLSPSILYNCYLRNKDSFSEKAQTFLECFVFNTRPKEEYKDSINKPFCLNYRSLLLDKLEKLYFNVHNILYSFGFTKEQWLKVLEKHENKFSENRIIAMNMFYGIDGEAMSIPEIAEAFDVDRLVMHDYIAKTRKTAMALYMNRSSLRDIDSDIYTPYVLNRAYPLVELNREILIMVVVLGMSYTEVKEELKLRDINLSQYQISNIVTESLRKLDAYRFGIVETYSFSEDFINSFLEKNAEKFTQKEKGLIHDKYILHIDNDALASKYKMPKVKLNKQIQRFNTLIDNFKIQDVILLDEDYIKEFNANPLERVVNEKQMHMLSYYYGVKCQYNPDGKCLGTAQMIKELPEYYKDSLEGLSRKIKKANDLIKLKKAGFYRNDLVYMTTDEIRKIMDDPHLPISDKEKYIICSIYGIRRHTRKTLDELAKIYKETKGSIRRRYQRAIIAIFKYQNGEIPAKIDFEYDILPLMRFFSKYDRMLIEDSYKNGLSYEALAKKYGITFNQMVTRFNRLNLSIFEMINNPQKEYFDFDFYEKAIKDPLLPFYGNLEEARKIFDLHFANTQIKNMSANEIAKELNINRDEKSINKTVYNLIMAVCRYKKGLRKGYTFTHEDVVDYYNRHKDKMSPSQESLYLRYFKRHLKEDANRNKELINKLILIDIIKERNQELNDIDLLSYDEIVNIIKTRHFSSKVLQSLLSLIGETERITMTGQELNHVYRLLNRLDKMVKLESNQQLALDNKKEIFNS